jgi:hypothetical protein
VNLLLQLTVAVSGVLLAVVFAGLLNSALAGLVLAVALVAGASQLVR